MQWTRIAVSMAVLVSLVVGAPPAQASVGLPAGVRPLPGAQSRAFEPPDNLWGAGHRGVDLQGVPGEVVAAAAAGVVSFAGTLAGRPVVTVSHGTMRTTYEPVLATVAAGESVAQGAPIGTLVAGHPGCPEQACLHWGLLSGDDYLDPWLLLVRVVDVQLIPAPTFTPAWDFEGGAGLAWVGTGSGPAGPTRLVRPSEGTVSSPFGMRRHPLDHAWRLHDGADFAASCGTPIRSAAAGVVIAVSWSDAYGNRAIVDHGLVGGRHLVTGYAHSDGYRVRVGTVVAAGEVIGAVGSTGWSTGCHLHFQAWQDDALVDPMVLL